MLKAMQGKLVSVMTTEGRHLKGTLSQVDQIANLVLMDAVELSYDEPHPQGGKQKQQTAPVTTTSVGLCLVRGDSVVTVGLVDALKDSEEGQAVCVCPAIPEIKKTV